MNNIEILEEMLKREKECLHYDISQNEVKAIENLIQENKELEKENFNLKEKLNDRLDIKQTSNSISFTMPSKVAEKYMEVLDETALEIENKRLKELIKKTEKDNIPKSKVRKKIEEAEEYEKKVKTIITVNGTYYIPSSAYYKILQEGYRELLEEGE